MKSGPEIVKAGLRSFFEGASDDIEKMVENLKLGKVSQSRTQVKGVGQNITYTTVALLPVLTSLFEHIAQHQFGDDVICEQEGLGVEGAVGSRCLDRFRTRFILGEDGSRSLTAEGQLWEGETESQTHYVLPFHSG